MEVSAKDLGTRVGELYVYGHGNPAAGLRHVARMSSWVYVDGRLEWTA